MTKKEIAEGIVAAGGMCPFDEVDYYESCVVCPCHSAVTNRGCGGDEEPAHRAKRVELCEAYLASLKPAPAPVDPALRDYFAAHAPPVPHHYKLAYTEPIPREPDGFYDSLSPCTQDEREAYIAKREAIVNGNELERVLSWPWFYADGVLERRGK